MRKTPKTLMYESVSNCPILDCDTCKEILRILYQDTTPHENGDSEKNFGVEGKATGEW